MTTRNVPNGFRPDVCSHTKEATLASARGQPHDGICRNRTIPLETVNGNIGTAGC